MTNNLMLRTACLVVVMFMSVALPASAQRLDVNDLTANNELQLAVKLSETSPIVVGQQLTITVELSSIHSFDGEMTFQWPKFDNAIVLPNNDFLYKTTREVQGQQWNVQYKELVVYPLSAGDFFVPELTIDFGLANKKIGKVSGQLITRERSFSAIIPRELKDDASYTVTPNFELAFDGQFDGDIEPTPYDENERNRVLEIGDSFTETITIRAEKLPSMMLPDILSFSTDLDDGISQYAAQAKLSDKYNTAKAGYIGERTQTITYVVEDAIEMVIPERQFVWWNSETNERKVAVIPARSFKVNASAFQRVKAYGIYAFICGLALLPLIIFYRYRAELLVVFHRLNKSVYKRHRGQYLQAIKQKDYIKAHKKLLEIFADKHGNVPILQDVLVQGSPASKVFEQLSHLAFDDTKNTASLSQADAKLLLAVVRREVPKQQNAKKSSKFSLN